MSSVADWLLIRDDKEDVIVQPNNLTGVSLSSDISNVASTVLKKEESEEEEMVLCLFIP